MSDRYIWHYTTGTTSVAGPTIVVNGDTYTYHVDSGAFTFTEKPDADIGPVHGPAFPRHLGYVADFTGLSGHAYDAVDSLAYHMGRVDSLEYEARIAELRGYDGRAREYRRTAQRERTVVLQQLEYASKIVPTADARIREREP